MGSRRAINTTSAPDQRRARPTGAGRIDGRGGAGGVEASAPRRPQPAMIRRSSVYLALVAASVVAVHGEVRAGRRDWTGSSACGTCHPDQFARWSATPHATTRRRFTAPPEPRCLACHGTGEAPAGPAIGVEVGCEACHGAGAAYAEDDLMRNRVVARALGLVDVATPASRAAVCVQCHARSTRGTAFDATQPVHGARPAP